VIEWETRVRSRGIRDVPIEVRALASQQKMKERDTRQPRAENNDMLPGETAPQPMDVDETFWAEEPVMPTGRKRVRQPAYPSLTNLTNLTVSTHVH
jgi:hypothetical protein